MIRRAQAEALLNLAEALEECERNEITIGANTDQDQCVYVSGRKVHDTLYPDLRPARLRMAIAELYPKTEPAAQTLLELLVMEIESWPKGVSQMAQDPDGIVYFWKAEKISFDVERGWRTASGFGLVDNPYCIPRSLPLASDFDTAVINKTMWKKAKQEEAE